jgi:hypothetical protein
MVHVEQYQMAYVAFSLISIYSFFRGDWIFGLLLLGLGGFFLFGIAMLVAWLRGESPYMGSPLEEAAYAEGRIAEEDKKI